MPNEEFEEKVNPYQEFFTPNEVAKNFDVSVYTVYRWVKTGRLKCLRTGRRMMRIGIADLSEFISNNTNNNE